MHTTSPSRWATNDAIDDGYDSSYGSDDETIQGHSDDELDQYIQPSLNRPPQSSLCIVCHTRPAYCNGRKRYSTCGLTCAGKLSSVSGTGSMCCVCGIRPCYSNGSKNYPTCGHTCAAKLKSAEGNPQSLCIVCEKRPSYSEGSKQYPTCGLTCAARLQQRRGNGQPLCIVCGKRPSYSDGSKKYPTCGLTCAAALIKLCDYCNKSPKLQNYPHCGKKCRDMAKEACLMCRKRPKNGKYHYCGRTCRDNARKLAPSILEIPQGHTTFDMVVGKFQKSWTTQPCPLVKKVYKVVEQATFRIPYDKYLKTHGNECFRYHGTNRSCRLGDNDHTTLCTSSSCSVCSILKTSFKVSLANPGGAFGQGVYTSSASSKSASYSSDGVMFLTKVVLGQVHNASQFAEVNHCPPGAQSVVYDRMNGQLNETVVYTDEAIRPVFLILFA